jgi:hypothetical protein
MIPKTLPGISNGIYSKTLIGTLFFVYDFRSDVCAFAKPNSMGHH